MSRIAKLISEFTIPPLIAAIVFPMLCFYFEPNFARALVETLTCWVCTTIFPIMYIAHLEKSNKISHRHIPIKEQRTVPYLIGTVGYIVGLVALVSLKAPLIVWGLLFCYITNTLIIAVINLFWKISAHAMGVSGPLAGAHYAWGIVVIPFYSLLLIVCWARYRINAHTFLQLLMGSTLGIVLTFAQLTLLDKIFG